MDEAWMRFEVSGKVDDYLQFKQEESGRTLAVAEGWREERPDGTEYRSDRDGLTCNANWRL